MSAIVCVFNRDGAPASEHQVHLLLDPLEHHGPDGGGVHVDGQIGIGFQHFWTTPEDNGIRQPIFEPKRRWLLAFDGRIDNREELARRLGVRKKLSDVPDTELVTLAYEKWGKSCFVHIIGPYAFLLADLERYTITLARDALGDRSLFYYLDSKRLLIATEPYTLLSHPNVGHGFDESQLAAFFARQWPADGSTFFRDIKELLPATTIAVTGADVEIRQYWRLANTNHRLRNGHEAAEGFVDELDKAVSSRLRSSYPVAVSLSGGLDSTSVTAIACQYQRIKAFSWTFDTLPGCDERRNVESIHRYLGLSYEQVSSDGLWPLGPSSYETFSPNSPQANMYAPLKQNLYGHAASQNYRVILNGDYGDNVYGGRNYWLRDLISHGHGKEFIKWLPWVTRRALVGDSRCRAALRRLLPFNGIRRYTLRRAPHWLTDYAAKLLPRSDASHLLPTTRFELDRYWSALTMYNANCETSERRSGARMGVERRCPFRDRRLVEFMLQLPAFCFYQPETTKSIARRGMSERLPETVLANPKSGLLTELFDLGIKKKESARIDQLLWHAGADWQRFVKPSCLPRQSQEVRREAEVLLWYCFSYESWKSMVLGPD